MGSMPEVLCLVINVASSRCRWDLLPRDENSTDPSWTNNRKASEPLSTAFNGLQLACHSNVAGGLPIPFVPHSLLSAPLSEQKAAGPSRLQAFNLQIRLCAIPRIYELNPTQELSALTLSFSNSMV
jgi:hypothetical protein